ncbi:galactose oxidase [Geosmithia morbida]|uniref:Galactose oxidase n=1 Tax=Geosmithia morbida TaxID=1094350 RepID=A0A9P4Z402_9HYPO|nr:galactose oxidase [Geosmithia morbida]KAF4126838.1 galactose oxidase [Geosmithia morbida]
MKLRTCGAIGALALGQLAQHASALPATIEIYSEPSIEAFQVDEEKNPTNFTMLAATPSGNTLDRSGWRVTCDAEAKGTECSKLVDGDNTTFWLAPAPNGTHIGLTHNVTVDLGTQQYVSGLSVEPRQDGSAVGRISRHLVLVSNDGKTWSDPVAMGNWYWDATMKVSSFNPENVRYVRLVAISSGAGNATASIAELNIYKPETAAAPVDVSLGKWGPTLDFPIVPVAGFVDPLTHKVVVWSAFLKDNFKVSPGGYTLTSTWDPYTGDISERNVSNTGHDMFCPGISMDDQGQVVVSGGSDAERTSLYDSETESWISGPDMVVARGYQSSATCSDGRVFTIGGSWGGERKVKNGEIYDRQTNRWTFLNGTDSTPLLTADKEGIYRADNHAWLFGWKNGTVYQAGPSKAMNWYYTSGDGNVSSAGLRADDDDSMCGHATMYDATAGKILTVGGSPWYRYHNATSNAHVVTIGEPGSRSSVTLAGGGSRNLTLAGGGSGHMHYRRVFHSSVALPDGTVFITGGQSYSYPFTDTTPEYTPEMYDPLSNTFADMQPNTIPRTYHSMALLLPDGTVFNGGGGLCGDCDANHFDAQIYTPSYLFDRDGNRAARPVIRSVQSEVHAGDLLTIATGSPVKPTASLIRYGTATHSINTDQRRVPLSLKAKSGSNEYTAQLPDDLGILLPGYWMLFVLGEDGVPSQASTVKVLI